MGLMIRFGAGPEEVAGLMKFLSRRTEGNRLFLAPLSDEFSSSAPLRKHRSRLTVAPLLRDLEHHAPARRWGLALLPSDAASSPLTEDDYLIQFSFGPADAQGRREIIFEVHDELIGDPLDLSPRAKLARRLGDRAIRRLRRRGTRDGLHWSLPT